MSARDNLTAPLNKPSSPLSGEPRRRMAKADLRKPEISDWRTRIGASIERTRTLTGWSLKEFADALGRDERQIARWIAGTERPQLDAIFAVPELHGPLLIALAELSPALEVETTLRIRRTA